MTEVVLHIGFPKTGTTSIQSACGEARGHLIKQGTLYPIFDTSGMTNRRAVHHLPFLISLMRHPPPRMADDVVQSNRLIDDLFEHFATSGEARLILSHESLSQRRDIDFDKLRRLLAGHSVHIIAYVRTYDEWIESLYVQHVKDQRTVSKTFARSKISNIDGERFLPKIQAFANALAGARVTVRSFDRFKSGGLVEDFLDTVGVQRSPGMDRAIAAVRERNVRPSSVQTMMMAYAAFGLQDNSMSPPIIRAFQKAEDNGTEIPFGTEKFGFMPYEAKAAARASYLSDLPKLSRRFGLEADPLPEITVDQLGYKTGLTASEFDALVQFVSSELSAGECSRLAGAYDKAAALIADA